MGPLKDLYILKELFTSFLHTYMFPACSFRQRPYDRRPFDWCTQWDLNSDKSNKLEIYTYVWTKLIILKKKQIPYFILKYIYIYIYIYIYVCVCVCVRERDRQRERESQCISIYLSIYLCHRFLRMQVIIDRHISF